MAGDIGAVALLLKEVFVWFTDPTAYAQLSREKKLEKLSNALKVALDNGALDAADVIYDEYRRMSAAGN